MQRQTGIAAIGTLTAYSAGAYGSYRYLQGKLIKSMKFDPDLVVQADVRTAVETTSRMYFIQPALLWPVKVLPMFIRDKFADSS